MQKAAITGTGLFTPPYTITNQELVESFNHYVDDFNKKNAESINRGEKEALQYSDSAFIEKASGIKKRYVMDKAGILDPKQMRPNNLQNPNETQSIQCEMSVKAAKQALENACASTEQIDVVIVGCSNLPRAYPALAIEIQNALGIQGFGYDMNVACATAPFAIQAANNLIATNQYRGVLVVNPEICSAHLNFRDRDSHFIFGDACTALVIQNIDDCKSTHAFEITSVQLQTQFSNNIRNNFGFLNRTEPDTRDLADKLFVQQGRKVFKEVTPLVCSALTKHLGTAGFIPAQIKRFWLHQANLNMNELIMKKLVGHIPNNNTAPMILDEYANTSSAGSIIALHKFHEDFKLNELGLLAAFGAGYSIGSVLMKKI